HMRCAIGRDSLKSLQIARISHSRVVRCGSGSWEPARYLCTRWRKLGPAFRVHAREFVGHCVGPTFIIYPGAPHMPEQSEKVMSFEIERDGDTAVVKCYGRLVA